MTRARAVLLLGLSQLLACDAVVEAATGAVTLPVVLSPPAFTLDVDEWVEDVEREICDVTEPLAPDCQVLVQLERSVTGATSDPPQLPDVFPVVFNLALPGAPPLSVDMEAFVERLGYFDGARFQVGVPIDLRAALTDEHVEALEGIRFRSVELRFDVNTLTFDLPPVRLYVVPFAVEEGADPEALIADGVARLCGVFGGQRASERAPLPFEPALGATEILDEALRARSFHAVIAVEDDAQVLLGKAEREGWRRKPGGRVALSLRVLADVAVDTDVAARAAVDGVE